ncbi:protein-L-isoaspartate O-methyltransferase [Patescibacteria group bacterium]|nr:protein-L-isoaspartate O-methyltransferase [Patescibacteria group bacterium]MBU1970202.1 protein-L-isoaspartate O-methyltransferase [Patescibacteria group bacterium]
MTGPERTQQALTAVNRADFLPPEVRQQAEINAPINIGFGQTNSQPSTVAFMLNLLEVQPGDKILDVGSGSGWTTALLAYLTGKTGQVIGVELVPELVQLGQANLAKYHFPWAKIVPASGGSLGFPPEAPYDKILVSASASKFPQELADQLSAPGRMVAPIGSSVFLVNKLENGELAVKEYPGFAFVPLIDS